MKNNSLDKTVRRLLLVSLLVSLTSSMCACSALFGRHGYFRDRGDDYVKAEEIPTMTVPDKLDSSSISELFVIPSISNAYIDTDTEFVAPRPDFANIDGATQVKIQKLDTRRWITIAASPSEVWPRVQRFLEQNKIETSMNDPSSGKIETAWLMLKNEDSSRDRYQIKVEQGVHANSCEIHVTQVTVTNTVPGNGNINWPSMSVNPEREKWLLDKLAVYLTEPDKTGASLLAQSVGGSRKIDFVQPYQAEPFIASSLDMERTWASVGGALNQLPFAIIDLNRSEGIYTVSYDPAPLDKAAPGYFSHLFGFDERARKKHEQSLTHYRVLVVQQDQLDVRTFIKNDKGEALPQQEAAKLLSLIRKQLL